MGLLLIYAAYVLFMKYNATVEELIKRNLPCRKKTSDTATQKSNKVGPQVFLILFTKKKKNPDFEITENVRDENHNSLKTLERRNQSRVRFSENFFFD